jgi:hypothetical protein
MKKLLAIVVAYVVSAGWAQSLLAQQAEDKGVPVEFFGCTYQDGKGMADLRKVADKFKKWSDENDSGYSAWILTPQFATDLGLDVGWLGAWPSGEAMGKGMDLWMSGGRELAAEFSAVVDCSNWHESATSAVVNAPKGPPGNGVVMFSECTVVEGKSPADALPAHRKIGAEMKAMGSPASSWLFYPGLGRSDIDFHYWSVIGFNNYAELGAATEIYVNGGGWEKAMGILGSVSRCRPPTVFDAQVVRTGAGR